MLCPFCGEDKVKTRDTRPGEAGTTRRQRKCADCARVFYTVERLDVERAEVVKRSGAPQPFSRSKVVRSIRKAAVKGSELGPREMDSFLDRIVRALQFAPTDTRVTTEQIGELVLKQLSDGTPSTDVTCIRYSIVFRGSTARRFPLRDAQDFIEWLRENFNPTDPIDRPIDQPVEVIDRYGRRDTFDYSKLERSIGVAAKGRGTAEEVSAMAVRLAHSALSRLRGQSLVSTQQMAQEVMHLLLREDQIAYLRYASAVKRYASADDFLREAMWAVANEFRR